MKRGEINPSLGCTDGHLRSQIRSALRKVWRNSSRRVFIESVRFKYEGDKRFKYAVCCVDCGRIMGQSQKQRQLLSDGTLSKKMKLVYEVDHVNANHELLSLDDLSEYAKTLLLGRMEIRCYDCHKVKTKSQKDDK
jgi:hypothetical protein